MIASPAVAWGTKTCSKPSPLPRTNSAAREVRSTTVGLVPVRTEITVLSMRPSVVSLTPMEFQDVVRRRRMVRRYDPDRPIPPDTVDRILRNAQRAPSAGFSQGWGFLALDQPEDLDRFR